MGICYFFLWNDLTWNDVNDLTMERNDRLPSCPEQFNNEQIKIFATENTESDTLYGRVFGKYTFVVWNSLLRLK